MDEAVSLELISSQAILVALSTIRIAVAFLLVPIFSRNNIPAIVRNSMFFALALVSVATHPVELESVQQMTTLVWADLFFKELFIGIAVGVFFGLFLWAFEAAGVFIDTQIGMSFALSFDPVIGNEATLFGTLLSRWSVYIFVGTGGLTLLVGALLESFVAWPLLQPIGGLREASVMLFEAELSRFMNFAVRIAAPIMIVLFLIDVALGMINRSAQHFNVFFLSTSIKGIAGIAILIILLPYLAQQLVGELASHTGQVEDYLQRLLEQ